MRNATTMIGALALVSGMAIAAPVIAPVDTTVTVGNDAGTDSLTLASGTAPNDQNDPFFLGNNLGNALGAADVRADWIAQPQGMGGGPNGGNQYNVSFRVGSRTPSPFGVNFNPDPIIGIGDTMPTSGDDINTITVEFGWGANGINFDDFGAATQILIENDFGTGVEFRGLQLPPAIFDGNPAGPQTDWVINGDGTLGIRATFDADSLFLNNANIGSALNGSLGGLSGFRTTVRVEVIPAPATAALLGLGGLAAVRRRR